MPHPTSSSTATPHTFPAHIEHQLDKATALCAQQGARMTAQRRDVLGLILMHAHPVGAYDLLEELKTAERRPAPPTVYRALDFLLEHGLIHRIERLSAFIPCTNLRHCSHTHEHSDACLHTAQFLICRNCKTVTEIADTTVLETLKHICKNKNFVIQSTSVEVEGLCANCASQQSAIHPAKEIPHQGA